MSESVDLKKVESLYQTLRKAEWQNDHTGSVTLVQHYPKTTPVIFWSLSILISLMTERQSVRFSSRVKFS